MDISTVKYRTFWRRFGAAIIDMILFFPIAYVMEEISHSSASEWTRFATDVVYGIFVYSYSIILHWRFGQTIGKMTTGVMVVRNDTEASIDLRQAFYRDLPPLALVVIGWMWSAWTLKSNGNGPDAFDNILVYVGLIWFALEFVTMLTNRKRRAIHDFIAGTVVVRI